MFNRLSFAISECWGTLSNAFRGSKKMEHASEPLSKVWYHSSAAELRLWLTCLVESPIGLWRWRIRK